ncbi:MAG TPA: hypothetical protein PKY59_14400 [Pyrinomonadaceae bacterium]|nr:hypothetical protein [Pyrinomonadaceae bacterium]
MRIDDQGCRRTTIFVATDISDELQTLLTEDLFLELDCKEYLVNRSIPTINRRIDSADGSFS